MEAVQISATPEAEAALREPLMKQAPAVILQGPDRLTVTQTTFSPDGQRLLAVFEDGSVRIWGTAAAGNPIVLTAQSTRYSRADGIHAAFSPDGSTVLTVPYVDFRTFLEPEGKSAAARIWDARTGQLVHELKHPYVQAGAFSPDGRRVVTVGYSLPDDTVRIWDAASGAVLSKLKDDEGAVVWVDYSRDGQLFVTASRDTANTVRIRAASDGKTIATLRVPGKTFVTAAMFSPDGRWLLTANQNEPIRLWDWRGAPGSSVAELQGSAGSAGPDGAVFSPDSKLLVTWGPDDSARIWQVPGGRTLYELPLEDRVTEAAFSPDGRWIVTAGLDRSAVLWDVSNGKRLLDFGGSDNPRSTAAFSPDGARIATGTPSGRVLLHSCAFCGSVEQLLSFGRTQVTRTLTAEERAKYLRPVAPP
jgi:WD40 repeat protein